MHYRQIWEKHHNQKIEPGYEIHHIDGNRDNNDIANLQYVSIEEHLEIHREQEDWGAVQAILMRMETRAGISEAASKHQKKLLANGEHNWQKFADKRKAALKADMAKRIEETGNAFIGIEDRVENARKAGQAAAAKKSGFLNTESKNHGSKYVKGSKWWVNKDGARKRATEAPGPDWKQGMKYEC